MSILRNGLIVLGIAFAVYVLLDLGVGAIFGRPHPAIPDFNQIPALRGQPYISSDFGAEYVLNDFLDAAPDDRLLWEPLARGDLFQRRGAAADRVPITGVPPIRRAGDKPVLTVLFLGASKVYGTEVPDDLTLPSLLSQRLNALDPAHGYVVYNAGVQAVTSREELVASAIRAGSRAEARYRGPAGRRAGSCPRRLSGQARRGLGHRPRFLWPAHPRLLPAQHLSLDPRLDDGSGDQLADAPAAGPSRRSGKIRFPAPTDDRGIRGQPARAWRRWPPPMGRGW